jgi:hypothetical protein
VEAPPASSRLNVSNNAKLILDAEYEANIISDFEVQSGSELEIK